MKTILKKNMGTIDRLIRIITGIILIYLGFINQDIIGNETVNILVGVFGLVSSISAIFSYCPIYNLGNISTNKASSEDG